MHSFAQVVWEACSGR